MTRTKIERNKIMTGTKTRPARSRRISKAAKFAMENVGFIYEVTDPELRSQLSFYRKHSVQTAPQV